MRALEKGTYLSDEKLLAMEPKIRSNRPNQLSLQQLNSVGSMPNM